MRSSTLATAAIAACAALFAALYCAAISKYWNISPDSSTYVEFAKSLAAAEWPETPPPQPPMTSVVYAPLLAMFPDSYLPLNALTRGLLFVALALFYALLARRSGPVRALLCILLTLASVSFYHASTQLLSEPAYTVFSAAALLLVTDRESGTTLGLGHGERGVPLRIYAAGVLMILAAMTRTIGVALALAVLVVLAVTRNEPAAQRRSRFVLAAFAVLSFVAVVLWDVLVLHGGYAGGWFVKVFGTAPPACANAVPGPSSLERMISNAGLLPVLGSVLINARWPQLASSSGQVLRVAATLLFAGGLLHALRRRIGVTEIYVAIFCAASMLHVLRSGQIDQNRFFVPVLPLIFAFTLEAVDEVSHRFAQRIGARHVQLLSRAALVVYAAVYVARGMSVAVAGVSEAHFSPFGSYPIRRAGNYDAQRIALWLKEHSPPDAHYASAQISMFDVLTERRGYQIIPDCTQPPEAFVAWLDEAGIQYVFVDDTTGGIRDPVLAVVRARAARFDPVLELPHATLYEVKR